MFHRLRSSYDPTHLQPWAGYDGGRALSYHDAVSILKGEQSAGGDGGGLSDSDRAPSMFWNAPAAEHFMSYLGRDGEQHIANYPTLAFIQVGGV